MGTKLYYKCIIKDYLNIIKGNEGNPRKVFTITHTISNEQLSTLSLAEAFRIAKLLNKNHQLSLLCEDNQGDN